MNPVILSKDHLVPLLRKISRSRRLIAPLRNEHGDTIFSEITDLDGAVPDLDNQAQNSLKPFFFPQTEKLSSYIIDRDPVNGALRYSFHAHLPENRPTLYFGVRSCDMFGLMYTDMIFLGGAERDIYYEQRRKNAVFITIGCNHPWKNCFCNATRTGPFLEMGFDLQLTDIGNRFFVEADRAGGMKILRNYPQFFRPVTEEDRRAQFQAALEARGLFRRLVHVDLAVKLLREQEPESLFAELSGRCRDCGGCAFLCPTCTCFNITDRQLDEDGGERIRSWDACTFSGFSLMAGNHNPVDCSTGRIRRRFLHKLKHDTAKHGRPSCVGCGRCVDICFGGVDIVRFINSISALEEENGREENHER